MLVIGTISHLLSYFIAYHIIIIISPSAIEQYEPAVTWATPVKAFTECKFGNFTIPDVARQRMEKAGIDLSRGYPAYPPDLVYKQDVAALQPGPVEFSDPGLRADKEKKALFGAAKEVRHLTYHCGTEIVGLQLKDLTSQQKDELAFLVSERGVVFFRDQDLSPQQQRDVTAHFGPVFVSSKRDLVHLPQTFGIIHLHYDTVLPHGGDILWASGYAAYCKISPDFRKFIDGKKAVMRPGDSYLDRDDATTGRQPVEEIHPIVRVHPVTGWKCLFVNRPWALRIIGLEKAESNMVLQYLFNAYENTIDIQCRWRWALGTSALWDNRCTLHNASWDYENRVTRHGTRVATVAEKPYFDANAPAIREALGLEDE
ncbi:putative alpha-ketoglutarate-dependent sulfonate dioxygenase [Nemania diffusa]|nr:putative alpha-ketoglutarate-dependent sulfonate dioxygenase [Nemania diffusa]